MEQLYFLSIVANTLAGLVLVSGHLGARITVFGLLDKFFSHAGVRIIIGFLVSLIGLIKLIWPYLGIPVIGDLFPAVAGLGGGFTLLFDFMRHKSDVKTDTLGKMDKIFVANKFLIGVACIVIAALHFFLNGIVLF